MPFAVSGFTRFFPRPSLLLAGTLSAALALGSQCVFAQPAPSPQAQAQAVQEPTKNEEGRYIAPDGTPTYKIGADGTLDWYTFSGFRRYHAECHTCHGPEGEGSSYAPALVNSLKRLS